jgi:molecular chaperone Hsp33
MSEASLPEDQSSGLEVRCYFVRKRNALLVRADFETLFVEHYLHLADREVRYTSRQDELFKDSLAALTLHCASRPWNESTAWTINFQSPLINIFVTGDNNLGTIVGQLFSEDVKENAENLFYAKAIRGKDPLRTSAVSFQGSDVFQAVEHYYHQSEQRPARYFRLDEEDIVMITAQPDCDLSWFEKLDASAVREMDQKEELSLLEQRSYRWQCGCNHEKIYQLLSVPMQENPEALFEDEDSLRISCPRCGIKYLVTREALEAFLARQKK